MRKFLVVLLALGLVVAFSMPAAASDVKFGGTYWVKGYYESNTPKTKTGTSAASEVGQDWYAQRLRVEGTWAVADGLTLNTRFDAMEKIWGSSDTYYSNAAGSNISWERCFITYKSPIGKFDVGYMSAGGFGTVFNDDVGSAPRIKYTGVFGSVIVLALTEKGTEKDGIAGSNSSDEDYDKYALAVMYKFQGGIVGALWFYLPDKTNTSYDLVRNYLPVYAKWTLGDLYLEAEVSYFWGTYDYDAAGQADKDISGMSAYIYGKYKLGPAYVGAQYGYVEYGKNTATEWETGYYDNSDWDPCLILFNYWLNVYQNNTSPATSQVSAQYGLNNGSIYQVFGGFSPMENLTIHASLSYAVADTKPTGYVDDEYGTEFDLTATWKIVDQLEYMIGFGYLFTGDYYKGTSASTQVEDDYLVMNQLTLSF